MRQTNESNFCLLGKVLRPRGLRGEVKVQVTPPRHGYAVPPLHRGGELFVDGVKYRISKYDQQGKTVFMKLEGVDTIEQAELLRNKEVYVSAPVRAIADDEVLVEDILGFSVVDEKGTVLGTLCAVENYGASDVFDCGTFSFPNEDAFIIETNMRERKIVIRAELL